MAVVVGVAAVIAASLAGRPAGAVGSSPLVSIVVGLDAQGVSAAGFATQAAQEPGSRYVVRVPAADAESDIARFERQAGVRYASLVQEVHASTNPVTPDDPCYTGQGCPASGSSEAADLSLVGAPTAWAVSKGAGVRVAVLDSGVDPTQTTVGYDLYGKIHSQTNICGQDVPADPYCPSGPDTVDRLGHGTSVSGILAADTDNGTGVASLGWDVTLDEYQVLDSQGNGTTADVATAIYDAVRAGDRVINMSLANDPCSEDLDDCGPDPDEGDAVEYAITHGVVVVAAAGNDFSDGPTYPASYPGVLSVAATDQTGVVQSFSEWGAAANIAAPGLDVVSTYLDGKYQALTGTSMAAPEVSAAAALLISHDPDLMAPQVAAVLQSAARPVRGGHPIQGGVLDVPAALAGESRPPTSFKGYELAGADGSVYSFGLTSFAGDLSGVDLDKPVVAAALQPSGVGYWLVASDGGVFGFGDAGFYGSTGGVALAKPVVGMAATPDGRGYWLVASDGGVFGFGDAGFYGSTGGVALAKPVVGMAATPDGRGYWLVASDGGVFPFGDAGFYGSTGGQSLPGAIVGAAS